MKPNPAAVKRMAIYVRISYVDLNEKPLILKPPMSQI